MSLLFSPLTLGQLELANRIIIAPMCQYSAENGQATDWHTIHLGSMALSGAGMLILEATAVLPNGRISYADLGLWDDKTEAALDKTLKSIRKYSNMPMAIQLAHAGRKASTRKPWEGGGTIAPDELNGWQTIAPSAQAFYQDAALPQAMTFDGIDELIAAFVSSAQRAERLGLDGIEIHAAHGYLLHQFLSPLSNQRTDKYGGSLENRLRLLLAVFDAIKAVISPKMVLGVRISATDWVDGGWDLAQSLVLAKALEARGCDFIHVSTGGLSPLQQIPVAEHFQVPFADAIKAEVNMPVIAVGLITDANKAETILAQGQADAIALARTMLYDPHWPWHAAATLGATVKAPPQYLRSSPHGIKSPIE
ncbi:NADH:flavin oxidoreductase/NADH oxidase [Shewanella putrefaciens]|uniref:NADH:flavin oxidoreductase/NADH oxidase n=1 Tax=Shewanella TaxID=22 RepID=UPI000E00E2E5|nr:MULTISPECIES: NADH:flavin oxidoreductase/NADH oxidase [Shewanella]MCU8094025.1 NADH:flavin oxidoreductase/NADH oxidase [Shewanella sp. SM20]UXK09977.1 NADH:flavin oxidoreductase/NADH oxidase [Shewanella putrefaciens]SUI48423.1 NADPH dehydrogenase [Shewanella putrefaciens]